MLRYQFPLQIIRGCQLVFLYFTKHKLWDIEEAKMRSFVLTKSDIRLSRQKTLTGAKIATFGWLERDLHKNMNFLFMVLPHTFHENQHFTF